MRKHKHRFAAVDSVWNAYWRKKYLGNIILGCDCGLVKFVKPIIVEIEEGKKSE